MRFFKFRDKSLMFVILVILLVVTEREVYYFGRNVW